MFFLKKLKLSLMVGYINLLNKLKLYNNYPVYYIGEVRLFRRRLPTMRKIIF